MLLFSTLGSHCGGKFKENVNQRLQNLWGTSQGFIYHRLKGLPAQWREHDQSLDCRR